MPTHSHDIQVHSTGPLSSHLGSKKAPSDDSVRQGPIRPVGRELARGINLDGQLGPVWNQQHNVHSEVAVISGFFQLKIDAQLAQRAANLNLQLQTHEALEVLDPRGQ